MSRNSNEVHASIFHCLVRYAADRGVCIPPGERRIHLDQANYDALISSRKLQYLRFGRRRMAALLSTEDGEILALCGFQVAKINRSLGSLEEQLSPGIAVALMADMESDPIAAAWSVLNVVAAGSAADSQYSGHDVEEVLRLFPNMVAIQLDPEVAGAENFLPNLLAVCALEAAEGSGWISGGLADELMKLAEKRITGFPYEFLIRAALDLDPGNLFLALYRCLEATYAFKRASELAKKLDVNGKNWLEVARALGETLSWYPRHDQSLLAVLSLPEVCQSDLDELAKSFGSQPRENQAVEYATKRLRYLRNSLVHYSPTSRDAHVPDDWNELCIPLARIVGNVFAHAYGPIFTIKNGAVPADPAGLGT